MPLLMSADETVKLIKTGGTIAVSGFVGMGHLEEISKGIEGRFLETGESGDLTLTSV
jgi:propionate CoA-transferase